MRSTDVFGRVLEGVTDTEGDELVEAFTSRWPLYGTVAVASPRVTVEGQHRTGA